MQALKYYRKKSQLTAKALAREVGVKNHVVINYETGKVVPDEWEVKYALKFANYFNVTIEEICGYKKDSGITDGDHAPIRGATGGAHNCVAGYRWAKNLTLDELAKLLGVGSREAARKACRGDYAGAKHVRTLAEHENMTAADFEELYMPENDSEEASDSETA